MKSLRNHLKCFPLSLSVVQYNNDYQNIYQIIDYVFVTFLIVGTYF